MEQWEIERLHEQGKMPDWIYYQQIDKPLWLKVEEQKQNFLEQVQERELRISLEIQIKQILEELLQNIKF